MECILITTGIILLLLLLLLLIGATTTAALCMIRYGRMFDLYQKGIYPTLYFCRRAKIIIIKMIQVLLYQV